MMAAKLHSTFMAVKYPMINIMSLVKEISQNII
jgi:hypothetical protein